MQKYVGGFRLFHCSANKPSGWTKAACRDDEHVRVRFRRASTLSPQVEPPRALSPRLEPPRVPREPSADEAHRIAQIITLCSGYKIGCCGLCSRIAEIAATVREPDILIKCYYALSNKSLYYYTCKNKLHVCMQYNVVRNTNRCYKELVCRCRSSSQSVGTNRSRCKIRECT